MNMETNKIFAAFLAAGIIAMLGGFVADLKMVSHGETVERGYEIEVADSGNAGDGGAAKPAGPEPIADLLAEADIARGEKLSKACVTCHSFNQGGSNGTGPNLWGIAGKAVGADGSYAYSDAMKAKGGTWTTAELNNFLWKPKKALPGTKMNYKGFKKTKDRAAIVAWLQTLK